MLVTHQVQFLARADRTLVLVEGRQLVFGTHSDLVASGVNLAAVAHHAGGAGGGEAGGGDEALAGGDKGGGGSGGGSGAGAGAGASAVGAAPPAPITLDDVTVVDHTDVKRAAAVAASAAGDAGSDVGRDESGDVASEVAAEVEAGALGRGRSLSGASIPALHALQVSRQQSSVGGAASVSVSVSLGVGRVARSRMPSDGSLGRASSLAEGEEAAAEEEAEEVLRDHFESMGEIDAIAAVADAHVGGGACHEARPPRLSTLVCIHGRSHPVPRPVTPTPQRPKTWFERRNGARAWWACPRWRLTRAPRAAGARRSRC